MGKYLNLKIIDYYFNGLGISESENKNYYVPFSLKNEFIYAKTINRHKGFRIAIPIEIKKSSEWRKDSPCEYYLACGACNFMHIDYNHQLEIKKYILLKSFEKYNINIKESEINLVTDKPLNYRNSAVLANKNNKLGYHSLFTKNNVVNIKNCIVLVPILNNVLKILQDKKSEINSKFTSIRIKSCGNSISLIFELTKRPSLFEFNFFNNLLSQINSKKVSLFYCVERTEPILYAGNYWFKFKFKNINYTVHPNSFLQRNFYIYSKIINYLKNYFKDKKFKHCLDLYSGCGMLGLSLIDYFEKLTCIENNIYSVLSAKETVKNNRIFSVNIIFEDVATCINNYDFNSDIIILNPPRSGAYIETLKRIKKIKPEYVIYLSCNAVSLAWNLSFVIDRYKIEDITIFDMFPQTSHIETLVILKNKK
ncbi:MAG: methyltransferase [Bacteroidales bacterium]|nr:methyltransferase [Bacteroidales bacterium]